MIHFVFAEMRHDKAIYKVKQKVSQNVAERSVTKLQ
jgi:hypothetical protein